MENTIEHLLSEIKFLRRQIRILQGAVVALAALTFF